MFNNIFLIIIGANSTLYFLSKFHEELPSHSQQADTDSILGLCVRQSLTDTQSNCDKLPPTAASVTDRHTVQL